jgi:hypothetical protein
VSDRGKVITEQQQIIREARAFQNGAACASPRVLRAAPFYLHRCESDALVGLQKPKFDAPNSRLHLATATLDITCAMRAGVAGFSPLLVFLLSHKPKRSMGERGDSPGAPDVDVGYLNSV